MVKVSDSGIPETADGKGSSHNNKLVNLDIIGVPALEVPVKVNNSKAGDMPKAVIVISVLDIVESKACGTHKHILELIADNLAAVVCNCENVTPMNH